MFTPAHATFSPMSLLIFTSSHLHIYMSAHLHICTSTSSLHLYIFSSSLLRLHISAHLRIPHICASHIFTSRSSCLFSLEAGGGAAGAPRNATLCGDCAGRGRGMQVRLRFVRGRKQPSAEIARVEGAKCSAGEIACWICPAQPSAEIVCVQGAKCRRDCVLDLARRNPLRRSCASSARNAVVRTAFWPGPAQRSAEIMRVEGAKCR